MHVAFVNCDSGQFLDSLRPVDVLAANDIQPQKSVLRQLRGQALELTDRLLIDVQYVHDRRPATIGQDQFIARQALTERGSIWLMPDSRDITGQPGLVGHDLRECGLSNLPGISCRWR